MATSAELTPHSATSDCGVERTLSVVRDHWSLLVLRDLMENPMRFNELKRSIDGISSKVLSERLKLMVDSGVVHKEVFAEVPVKVVYSLTEKGRDLSRVVDNLREWGEKWMPLVRAD